MKINQLFRQPIDEDLLVELLSCFDLKGLGDCTPFSRNDLLRHDTPRRLAELFPRLREHYIPCKGRIYLVPHNLTKCITILKQVVRLWGYQVVSREQTVNKEKIIVYHLGPEVGTAGDGGQVCHITGGPHTLAFD
jgi:hypothetical protein